MLNGQGLGLFSPRAVGLRCGLSPFDGAKSGLQSFSESQASLSFDAFHPFLDATVGANSEAECALGHAPQPSACDAKQHRGLMTPPCYSTPTEDERSATTDLRLGKQAFVHKGLDPFQQLRVFKLLKGRARLIPHGRLLIVNKRIHKSLHHLIAARGHQLVDQLT